MLFLHGGLSLIHAYTYIYFEWFPKLCFAKVEAACFLSRGTSRGMFSFKYFNTLPTLFEIPFRLASHPLRPASHKMSSKQSSASASSSRNPSPAPNTQQIDPYRTISSHLKRPLAPLLPQTEPLLPNLLSLNASIYSSRLSGKTLLTTPDKPSTTSSVLVQGRKRNRGNAFEKKKAREEHERNVKTREELGLEGMRKVRRRLGGVVGKGNRIS